MGVNSPSSRRAIDFDCGDRNAISVVRQQLKRQLIEPSDTFRDHKKEWTEIQDLVQRTVTMGESNSVLIVGPRGSGKTTLINCVLKDLEEDESLREHWLAVKLNGFLHTTDNLALKEATIQMGLENVVDDKVFGSFAENLKFLFDSLKAGDKEQSKAVIFVLEEFDIFCDHHNQSLLYNLFDVAQSQQAPICVVGNTCRLDVTELLEKRVKSRFSHRQVYLFPTTQDFGGRLKLFKHFLHVQPSDSNYIKREMALVWNKHVDALTENAAVKAVLKRMYEVDVSEDTLRTFMLPIVSKLSDDHPVMLPSDFTKSYQEFSCDAKTRDIGNLCILEICLLIAMKHHSDIFDGEPFNFEMIVQRYLKFTILNKAPHNKSRPVIMKAYENLMFLEYMEPIGKCGVAQQEFQLCNWLIFPSQLQEALKKYKNLPTDVEQWAISSLQ